MTTDPLATTRAILALKADPADFRITDHHGYSSEVTLAWWGGAVRIPRTLGERLALLRAAETRATEAETLAATREREWQRKSGCSVPDGVQDKIEADRLRIAAHARTIADLTERLKVEVKQHEEARAERDRLRAEVERLTKGPASEQPPPEVDAAIEMFAAAVRWLDNARRNRSAALDPTAAREEVAEASAAREKRKEEMVAAISRTAKPPAGDATDEIRDVHGRRAYELSRNETPWEKLHEDARRWWCGQVRRMLAGMEAHPSGALVASTDPTMWRDLNADRAKLTADLAAEVRNHGQVMERIANALGAKGETVVDAAIRVAKGRDAAQAELARLRAQAGEPVAWAVWPRGHAELLSVHGRERFANDGAAEIRMHSAREIDVVPLYRAARVEPPVDVAGAVGYLTKLFAQHCECRTIDGVDVMRESHSHDCDTDITDACREAINVLTGKATAAPAPATGEIEQHAAYLNIPAESVRNVLVNIRPGPCGVAVGASDAEVLDRLLAAPAPGERARLVEAFRAGWVEGAEYRSVEVDHDALDRAVAEFLDAAAPRTPRAASEAARYVVVERKDVNGRPANFQGSHTYAANVAAAFNARPGTFHADRPESFTDEVRWPWAVVDTAAPSPSEPTKPAEGVEVSITTSDPSIPSPIIETADGRVVSVKVGGERFVRATPPVDGDYAARLAEEYRTQYSAGACGGIAESAEAMRRALASVGTPAASDLRAKLAAIDVPWRWVVVDANDEPLSIWNTTQPPKCAEGNRVVGAYLSAPPASDLRERLERLAAGWETYAAEHDEVAAHCAADLRSILAAAGPAPRVLTKEDLATAWRAARADAKLRYGDETAWSTEDMLRHLTAAGPVSAPAERVTPRYLWVSAEQAAGLPDAAVWAPSLDEEDARALNTGRDSHDRWSWETCRDRRRFLRDYPDDGAEGGVVDTSTLTPDQRQSLATAAGEEVDRG